MTKASSRQTVQTHVDTTDWTLLLIVNDTDGFGLAVHDTAETAFRNEQKHRKTLLFEESALPHPDHPPTASDRKAGRYVVLARNTRRAVQRGPIADLLKGTAPDQAASIRSIRRAFAAGDQG
jgi:hypothetical protein